MEQAGSSDGTSIAIEDAFARLEEIIRSLEAKETGLQEAMTLYTEGVELLGNCQKTLEGVEQQLKILNPEDET